MTSHPSDRPVSALRARMIEDMRVRGFSEKTGNDYIRNVRTLAAFKVMGELVTKREFHLIIGSVPNLTIKFGRKISTWVYIKIGRLSNIHYTNSYDSG